MLNGTWIYARILLKREKEDSKYQNPKVKKKQFICYICKIKTNLRKLFFFKS